MLNRAQAIYWFGFYVVGHDFPCLLTCTAVVLLHGIACFLSRLLCCEFAMLSMQRPPLAFACMAVGHTFVCHHHQASAHQTPGQHILPSWTVFVQSPWNSAGRIISQHPCRVALRALTRQGFVHSVPCCIIMHRYSAACLSPGYAQLMQENRLCRDHHWGFIDVIIVSIYMMPLLVACKPVLGVLCFACLFQCFVYVVLTSLCSVGMLHASVYTSHIIKKPNSWCLPSSLNVV